MKLDQNSHIIYGAITNFLPNKLFWATNLIKVDVMIECWINEHAFYFIMH